MQNRAKITFAFEDTFLGYAYTKGYAVKGLIDVARFASYLTPTQLAANTFTLTAPTIAQFTGH